MLKSCLKFIALLVVLSSLFLFPAQSVLADRTINSATLDGSSSVTVLPSASITAAVNVTTDNLNDKNWRSTSWNISGSNCINHTDHNGAGTYNESFTVTAPSSSGTYDINFIAYADSACSSDPSPTFTLTNGITVSSPTPEPTSTPTPGPTPSPDATATTSSTVYYPTITLQRNGLVFSGNATIENGVIDRVEYSLDNVNWEEVTASDGKFDEASESFTFTPDVSFSTGSYTVYARAKSLAQVYSQSPAFVSLTVTAPSVSLDEFSPNPTGDTTPTLTGTASGSFSTISIVQVSLDGGKTWSPAILSSSIFSFTPEKLEDGNYEVIARAFDKAGNVGRSAPQTLIIDTIPPIIGGIEQSIGPQVLTSYKNGYVSLVVGVETTIVISMKGGVTEATINSENISFPLTRVLISNLWVGKMSFDKGGLKKLSIEAIDGAGNKTERQFNTVYIEETGKVIDKNTQQPVENAKVTVFFFERISQQWVVWEGASYGQTNPQKTTNDGDYSFILPAGKYYLEVNAGGFNSAQSEIFELSTTSVVNYPLQLTSRPKIELQLPFFGKVVLSLPNFSPPDSIPVKTEVTEIPPDAVSKNLQSEPDSGKLNLLDLEGNEVTIDSFKGKKLLLSFISPWSALSQEQAPFLTETSSALSDEQEMLVIALQEGVSTTQAFMRRGSHTFPVVADKDGVSANVYNVTLLPYHVFFDSNGKIHSTYSGVLNKNELLKNLNDVP